MQTALGLFYSDKTTYAGLVQRPQNPGPRWPHRVENSIRLGVAGVGLNGIPAVNDLPVLYEHGIRARMPVILETNTSHPGPAVERVYPAKSRYCECVVGCAIFEGVFEVIGDEVCSLGPVQTPACLRLARQHRCMPVTGEASLRQRAAKPGTNPAILSPFNQRGCASSQHRQVA
jgi:hypothetical protein